METAAQAEAPRHHVKRGYALANEIEAIAREAYPERGPKAIHRGQWALMRAILDEGGCCNIRKAAARLGLTHGPASRACAALVRAGLATIEPAPCDRRHRLVTLTQAAMDALRADPLLKLGAAIDAMPPYDQIHFMHALVRLRSALREAAHGS